MTAWSKTITNAVNVFGEGPTSMWGQYSWGSFKWGEGTTDTLQTVEKLISNSQLFDTVPCKEQAKLLVNTQTVTSDPGDEYLYDGSGYNYVFKAPTTDGEQRYVPSWAQGSATGSWTKQTMTTTWS